MQIFISRFVFAGLQLEIRLNMKIDLIHILKSHTFIWLKIPGQCSAYIQERNLNYKIENGLKLCSYLRYELKYSSYKTVLKINCLFSLPANRIANSSLLSNKQPALSKKEEEKKNNTLQFCLVSQELHNSPVEVMNMSIWNISFYGHKCYSAASYKQYL